MQTEGETLLLHTTVSTVQEPIIQWPVLLNVARQLSSRIDGKRRQRQLTKQPPSSRPARPHDTHKKYPIGSRQQAASSTVGWPGQGAHVMCVCVWVQSCGTGGRRHRHAPRSHTHTSRVALARATPLRQRQCTPGAIDVPRAASKQPRSRSHLGCSSWNHYSCRAINQQ
jgi:hypothetical protein